MNKKIYGLAEIAKDEIANFCMTECKGFCCREGYIIIRPTELDLMATKIVQQNLEATFITRELLTGKIALNFSNSTTGCPALKNGLCTIHKNPDRANVCKNFPIFINGKEVKVSPRCLAVQKGMLDNFKIQAKKLGYNAI